MGLRPLLGGGARGRSQDHAAWRLVVKLRGSPMLVGSDAAGSGSAAVANDGGFHRDANGQRFDVGQCGLFDPLALC